MAVLKGATSLVAAVVVLTTAMGCGGESEEAPRYDVPIYTDGSNLVVLENDRAYEVEIKEIIHRVDSVDFTAGGESHASLTPTGRLWDLLVPDAMAHPNHSAGGEVAGTLPGPRILAFRQGEVLKMGTGRFLGGDYEGYNFAFSGDRDVEVPEVEEHFEVPLNPEQDLMAVHRGVVRDGEGNEYELHAEVTISSFAEVYGGALSASIPENKERGIALTIEPSDDWSESSLYDISFSNLVDDEGVIRINEDTNGHSLLRTALGGHEFYGGHPVEE